MIAQKYLDTFHQTCVFHDEPYPNACGRPAVAVYVSDDEEPKGQYVCERHARFAEEHGDGPVFWQRFPVPPGDEVNRLTLAHEEN